MFVSSLIGLSLVHIVIARHKNLSVVLNSVIDMDALWDTQGLLTVRAPERSLLPLPTSPFRFNRITPFTIPGRTLSFGTRGCQNVLWEVSGC